MTEWTVLDSVFTALLVLLTIGLWGMVLERLQWQDRRANRENQCPPHQWETVYRDKKDGQPGEYIFDGLKCAKCGRRPNGLHHGESWFGPLTPP